MIVRLNFKRFGPFWKNFGNVWSRFCHIWSRRFASRPPRCWSSCIRALLWLVRSIVMTGGWIYVYLIIYLIILTTLFITDSGISQLSSHVTSTYVPLLSTAQHEWQRQAGALALASLPIASLPSEHVLDNVIAPLVRYAACYDQVRLLYLKRS